MSLYTLPLHPSIRALVLSSWLALTPAIIAQSVTTDPVGFTKIACSAASDTMIAMTLTRPAAYAGSIASVSGNTVTLQGAPNFAANQFVYASPSQPNNYYAILGTVTSGTNPKEGEIFQVTANATGSITLNLAGEDLSSVPAGTKITIIPYWTLGTTFPAANANVSFIPSVNAFARNTEIIIPNYSGVGTNLSSSATYFYLNNGWRMVGDSLSVDHSDDVLLPTGFFRIRNNGTASALTLLGAVVLQKVSVPLATQANTKQDNFVSLMRPVDVSLNDLGLISSGAFTTTTMVFNRTDELFVYDNTSSGLPKSPSVSYFYYSGAWRKVGGDLSQDFGTDKIAAGTPFVIRKAATSTGSTQSWLNSATY